jgi:hypothetical protein
MFENARAYRALSNLSTITGGEGRFTPRCLGSEHHGESGGKPPFLTSSFLRLEPSPRRIKRESHRESNEGDIKASRKLGKLGVGKGGLPPQLHSVDDSNT